MPGPWQRSWRMERGDSREFKQSKVALFSKLKPRNIFPGEWESIFTGDGIEFAAIEPLEPGDDLRDLDLHALVQSGEERVIRRVAGRQIRVFVWLDLSGSMQRREPMLFSKKPEIRDIAVGLILFSACGAYSPLGLCAFDGGIRRFFPARSGEGYCWAIVDWLTSCSCEGSGTRADLGRAIAHLVAGVPARSLVFLVSDFCEAASPDELADLLRPAASRFDLVPVVLRDPLEKAGTLRWPVRLPVCDSEGGASREVYLTPERLRLMQQASARHLTQLERCFGELGIGHVVLDSASIEDCHRVLSGFFEARRASL